MTDYQPQNITRTFEVPRQVVWDAWTNPSQLKEWYMPKPFGVKSCELDVRPGGLIKIYTQGPDGTIMPLTGEYKIVEEPSKLVMTNSPLDADGNKLFEIRHTILLTENNGQTTLNITSEVLSAGPDAEQFLSGMKPGLEQAFDQLEDLVKTGV
jgi:uncharacterized protein YndB with AHSA1/START domain